MFRVAENLGQTAVKVVTGRDYPMSAVEVDLWRDYRNRNGFKTDRLEWAVANGSSAVAQTMGAKVKARELVPRFGSAVRSQKRATVCTLGNMNGVKTIFVPRDKTKPKLYGVDAMAMADGADEVNVKRTTLKDGTRPEKSANRTL